MLGLLRAARGGGSGQQSQLANIQTDFGAVDSGNAADVQKFVDFNTWGRAQTTPVFLIVPPGTYNSLTGANENSWTAAVRSLDVSAYGATLNYIWLGGHGQRNDTTHSALVETVLAGASVVRLVTPAQHSIFSVDGWVMITGVDMQSVGGPVNPYYFEYHQVMAINTVTGDITLSGALRDTYKSTWPKYPVPQPSIDHGGPATLYAMGDSWNVELAVRGLTYDDPTYGFYGMARTATLVDITALHENPAPSNTLTYRIIRGSFSDDRQFEHDKLVDTLEIYDSTFRNLFIIQSANHNMLLDGCTFLETASVLGTAKHTTIRNTTIADTDFGLQIGPTSFGRTETLLIEDSTIAKVSHSTNGITFAEFSYADGELRVETDFALVWAQPGAKVLYADTGATLTFGLAFTVLDLEKDGDDTVVITDGPAALFNDFPVGYSVTRLMLHPGTDVTVRNSTGCDEIVDLSTGNENSPLYHHAIRTLTGSLGTGSPTWEIMKLWGTPASVRVNVTTPYTGVRPVLTMNTQVESINNADRTLGTWAPKVNLKISGERLATPSGITGAQSGDTLTTLSDVWIAAQVIVMLSHDISGEDESVWPEFTIEIFTDQGLS